jgi:hypothetical protein
VLFRSFFFGLLYIFVDFMVAFFFCVLFFSAFYALPSMACVAEQREYDGSCIDGTSSSGSPGQTFGRLGTSNPNWDSSAAPTGDALPNNGQQTMLTISFLEFILLDIIGFDASAYVNNTSPKMYQNIETSWIDGSHVYGHDKNSAPIKAVSGNFSGYIIWMLLQPSLLARTKGFSSGPT